MKNYKKIVLGVTSGSLLIGNGCTSDLSENPELVNGLETDSLGGNSAISMRYTFADKDKELLTLLVKLSEEVLVNPEIAKKFAENPSLYLKEYGFDNDLDISKSDPYLNLYMAIADEDIKRAIDTKNVPAMISICKNKGYLFSFNNPLNEYLMGNNSIDGSPRLGTRAIIEGDPETGFFALVIFAVGALYYYVSHWETKITTNTEWSRSAVNAEMEIPSVLELYTLDGDLRSTFVASEIYTDEEINFIMDYIKAKNPSLTKEQEEKYKNIVRLNLVKFQEQLNSMNYK